MKHFFAAILLALSFAGQINLAQQPPQPSQSNVLKPAQTTETQLFARTQLFFGRSKPNGGEVSEAEFADFLETTITPEFPDGLTVLDGVGQFRDVDGGTIREKAKILILLFPASARKRSSRKIERIRAIYKTRFDQQSVLRADDLLPLRVSF